MQMKDKINIWIVVAAAAVAEIWALYVVSASATRWRPTMIVENEPQARALYEAMLEAARRIRAAEVVAQPAA